MPPAKSLVFTVLLPVLLTGNTSNAQSHQPVKGRLDFRIVPNIMDPNKSPYIPQQLFKEYKQQLLLKGPLFGRDRKDEFQWFEIMPGIPKPPPVAYFQGKQYVLLCTLPPFAMPADYTLYGGRIWGLTKVKLTKDKSANPVISLELDKNGTKILNELTDVNRFPQNRLAILVDDTVLSILKIEIRIWQNVEITGMFTPQETEQIVSSLQAAMPPVKKYLFPLRPFKKGFLPPDESIDYWKRMLESPISQTRLAAVKDMWRARHETTAAMLLAAVSDPHPAVSKEAMYMTEMNQKVYINTPAEPILELLKSDRHFHRAHAARLTTSHHDPNKFYQAAVAASSDSDGVAREWAFEYFKKNPPPDQVKQNLMKAVLEEPVPRTRIIAAETLYYLALPEAAPSLMMAIEKGTLSTTAFKALISCGGPGTIQFLTEQARSDSLDTRANAVWTIALAGWFPRDKRDTLVLQAINDPALKVRTYAYEVIGRRKIAAANAALRQKILKGEDLDQETLFSGLSCIADRKSGEALFPFIEKEGRIGELALDGVVNSANDSLINQLLSMTEKETGGKKKEKLGWAICQILEKNPGLVIDSPDRIQQLSKLIKEISRNRLADRITLYQGGLAVADVNFFQRGERWLLKCIDDQWTVLVRFGTWVD